MDIFSDVKKQQSDEFLKALASLTEDERENFEERAGIMEFHGGLKREEAEKRALEIMFTSFSSLLRKPPEEVRLIVHHRTSVYRNLRPMERQSADLLRFERT